MKTKSIITIAMAVVIAAGAGSAEAKKRKTSHRQRAKTEKTESARYVAPPAEEVRGDYEDCENTDIQVKVSAPKMPMYPGGDKALLEFLSRNIQYPEKAQRERTEGKVVLQFVVTKKGRVGNVYVLKSVSPEIDAEAVRCVRLLHGFIPGEDERGRPVNVFYTLPINFKL